MRCQVYRTLFQDNDDGEGSIIDPGSIPRMQVVREEVEFYSIKIESKAIRHQAFDKWARWIIAQLVFRSCSIS